ncbi:MAG: hypothetical protein CMM25_09760 [Rhodospirillaceae bacterium]|nr:hypothetical protein [Rhodospirillaceae bacterium]|tara:strand:+ start:1118 stop:1399 length:282 start_codon:yes stop_codon:yes gene_type:complete
MPNPLFLIRLILAILGSLFITSCILALLMWLNGFISQDDGSAISYTQCVFGSQENRAILNPYEDQPLTLDCIKPEDARPLYLQWFDKILGTRE